MKKLVFLFALLPILLFSQHNIQGIFSPADQFTYAFLYQSHPTTLDYMDRSKVEADGSFQIALDSTVKPGMYKIVYGLPQKDNNFDFIYDGKENIALTFSLDEGLVFTASNENKLWASYTKSMELVNLTISNFYTKEGADKNGFKDIFKTLSDTQNAFEEASKGTMAKVFIMANRPYIPTEYEDISTYSKHLKSTYLTNVDFSNPLLQSSDFLGDRVLAYVFGMSATNDNAAYKQHIDDVVDAIGKDNDLIKTSLLQMLWQHFVDAENTEVANYISKTHLYKLAKETNDNELYKALMTYQNSSVGSKAMDFPISYEQNGKTINTSLYKLSGAEHYVLIFWSSTCSHCLNELPKVKSFIDKHPKNMKVIAFGLEDDKENWEKTIPEFPDFIHVLGLKHWDNPVAMAYGINRTPTYFILDKDKKIISKPEDLETFEKDL